MSTAPTTRAVMGLAAVAGALAGCGGSGADGSTGAGGSGGAVRPSITWFSAPAPNETRALRVSAGGEVVVGAFGTPDDTGASFAGSSEAFRWTSATGVVGLGTPAAGSFGAAVALDAAGDVVFGNAKLGDTVIAFRWSAATGLGALPSLQSIGDASADASVIVGLAAGGPARDVGNAVTPLFASPPASASADAVSADGTTVVGRVRMGTPPQDLGYVWTAGALTTLSDATASMEATAVNADGGVVVGYISDATAATPARAFRWQAVTGPFDIGAFTPTACDATGTIVVGNTQSPARAWIWDIVHGARALDDVLRGAGIVFPDGPIENVYDISADGRVVVGEGRTTAGTMRAFRAVLPSG